MPGIEPVAQQIITMRREVQSVEISEFLDGYRYKVQELPAFHVSGELCLRPGDRVKITITKEPPADVLHR